MTKEIKALLLCWLFSSLLAFWLWAIPCLINHWDSSLTAGLPRSGWVKFSEGEIEVLADDNKWEIILYNGRPIFKDKEQPIE